MERFLGLPRVLNTQEYLNMEIEKLKEAKRQVLIYGLDPPIIYNKSYINNLLDTANRGVKVKIILHKMDSPVSLENLADIDNLEVYRAGNRFIINEGFRAYDDRFAVSFNKARKSACRIEQDSGFFRYYLDDFSNRPLQRAFNRTLKDILRTQ